MTFSTNIQLEKRMWLCPFLWPTIENGLKLRQFELRPFQATGSWSCSLGWSCFRVATADHIIPLHLRLSSTSSPVTPKASISPLPHNINYPILVLPLSLSQKKKEEESLFLLYFHSLGSDVSDHFSWSEYRVNRTRFHLLSSEFSLYWS